MRELFRLTLSPVSMGCTPATTQAGPIPTKFPHPITVQADEL